MGTDHLNDARCGYQDAVSADDAPPEQLAALAALVSIAESLSYLANLADQRENGPRQ